MCGRYYLEDEMNTEEAKKMAETRHACMVRFLSQLNQELKRSVSGEEHNADD